MMSIRKALAIGLLLTVAAAPLLALTQFLTIEGVKVSIDSIELVRADTSATTATLPIGAEVDLATDLSGVFSEAIEIQLEPGVTNPRFDIIRVNLQEESVAIKGYTYIAGDTEYKYTTALGIGTLSGSTWAAPADYDYLPTGFLYFPDPVAGSSTDETTYLQTSQELDLSSATSPTLSLLVDVYQNAYYWDGDDAGRLGFVSTVPLDPRFPGAFPAGTPVIGLSYLPLYVAIDKTVTQETYAVTDATFGSFNADDVYELDEVMYMTLTFDSVSGEFYQGRISNFDEPRMAFGWMSVSQFVLTSAPGTVAGTINLGTGNATDGADLFGDFREIAGFERQDVGGTGTATLRASGETDVDLQYKRVR